MNDKAIEQSKSEKTYSFTRKQIAVAAIVVIVIIGALLVWKAIQVSSLENRQEAREQQVKEEAGKMLVQSNVNYLKMLAKTYVWAAQIALMQGNTQQLNSYANDLIKEKNFQSISVADTKGVIISSTNKKFEGTPVANLAKSSVQTDSTVVVNSGDSLLQMISPVMGYTDRLGTLVINYMVRKPEFQQ